MHRGTSWRTETDRIVYAINRWRAYLHRLASCYSQVVGGVRAKELPEVRCFAVVGTRRSYYILLLCCTPEGFVPS